MKPNGVGVHKQDIWEFANLWEIWNPVDHSILLHNWPCSNYRLRTLELFGLNHSFGQVQWPISGKFRHYIIYGRGIDFIPCMAEALAGGQPPDSNPHCNTSSLYYNTTSGFCCHQPLLAVQKCNVSQIVNYRAIATVTEPLEQGPPPRQCRYIYNPYLSSLAPADLVSHQRQCQCSAGGGMLLVFLRTCIYFKYLLRYSLKFEQHRYNTTMTWIVVGSNTIPHSKQKQKLQNNSVHKIRSYY